MIVKNEEKFLEGCLQSVQGVVNEIILVDTGSSDATLQIAERYGAKIFHFNWTNDFAAARNESLKSATGEWILYLDADERLAPGQEAAIKSLLQNPKAFAYSLLVGGDHFLPTGIVKQQNAYPRLFRKHHGIRFEGAVHEQITPSILHLGKSILPAKILVQHLGYGQSLEIVREKSQRNIELLRDQLKRNPGDAYARFQLGNTLSVLGEYEAARKELTEALESLHLAQSIQASVLNLLAEIDIRQERYEEAISKCLSSLKLAPSQVLARWFLAAARIGGGNVDGAIAPLKQILEIQQHPLRKDEEIAHDVIIEESKVLFQLGHCYEHAGQHDEAFSAYLQALRHDSTLDAAREGLERVVGSLTDYHRAIQQAETNGVFLYPLYKKGVEMATQAGEFSEAIGYIEKIVGTSETVPESIKQRLGELKGMLLRQLQ